MSTPQKREYRRLYRKRVNARAYDNAYMQRPHVKRRRLNARLVRTFGITLEQRDQMIAVQGHRCAICKGPPRKEGWHVDHDHATNTVRGVLCGKCNTGLGLLKDNPLILAYALAYLYKVKLK